MRRVRFAGLCVAAVGAVPSAAQTPFSFAPHLDLNPPKRTLHVGDPLVTGRTVQVNGSDSAQPTTPFLFDWGDGQTTEGWFPADHTYARSDRNFVLSVTARYANRTDTVSTTIRLAPPRYRFTRSPDVPRRVSIPRESVALGSTMPGYEPPQGLAGFQDEDLGLMPREAIEYLLDVGHRIQLDLCNEDVTREAATRQVVLKQTQSGSCGSLWFTDPVSFVCHPGYLGARIDLSSLLHELAHNLTLNSPAAYRFGGKTDGPMNTIVSETLAQIFQHATTHVILNTKGHFGLSEDICDRLRTSAIRSIGVVREAHRTFLKRSCPYATYNDPVTERDDTFETFMTVAYVFCDLSEKRGDYRRPLKRMMRLMQTFGPSDHARFQERENEAFRASFLVVALSYAFDQDLRKRFREMNFPISDEIHAEFLARMKGRGG